MKTIFKFFGLFVLLASSFFLTECKKDSSEDPVVKFLGSYNYNMTVTGMTNPGSASGTFTVGSTIANKIFILSDGSLTDYTVNGNTITEDAGQTTDLPISGGGTASFVENSTGTLTGSVLTINGTWSKTGYNTISFAIVATKK